MLHLHRNIPVGSKSKASTTESKRRKHLKTGLAIPDQLLHSHINLLRPLLCYTPVQKIDVFPAVRPGKHSPPGLAHQRHHPHHLIHRNLLHHHHQQLFWKLLPLSLLILIVFTYPPTHFQMGLVDFEELKRLLVYLKRFGACVISELRKNVKN